LAPASYAVSTMNVGLVQDSPVDDSSPNSSGSGSSSHHPHLHPRPQQRPNASSNTPQPNFKAQESFSQALEELFGSGEMVDQSMAGGHVATPFQGLPRFDLGQSAAFDFPSQHINPQLATSSSIPLQPWDSRRGGPESARAQLPPAPLLPNPQFYSGLPFDSSHTPQAFPVRSQIFDTFPPTLHSSSSQPSNSPAQSSSTFYPPFSNTLPLPAPEDTTVDPALRSHLLGLFFQKARNFRFSLNVSRFVA